MQSGSEAYPLLLDQLNISLIYTILILLLKESHRKYSLWIFSEVQELERIPLVTTDIYIYTNCYIK